MTKFWRISPGEDGFLWNEQKANGCIAIGWDEIGDAKNMDKKALRAACSKAGFSSIDANQLNNFINLISIGDKVVASASAKGIFAIGTITGDYEFDRKLEYKHSRKVKWEKIFSPLPSIVSLNLPVSTKFKFYGRSSRTIRELDESEWIHLTDELGIEHTTSRPDSVRQKITRITFNSQNWQRPSGDARKNEAPNTYAHKNGFGHEEWLFRSEWKIGGWRYAFMQGVNDSRRKLLEANKPVDISLFTIEPDKRRRLVATIKAVECLDDRQAEAALKIFKKNGWFKTMLEEIKSVNGNVSALNNSPETSNVLNIRFRSENVISYHDEFISEDDPIAGLNRYMLYDFAKLERKAGTSSMRRRKEASSGVVRGKVFRRATEAVEYDPKHIFLQAKLIAELKKEFPGARIVPEEDFIDVSVQTETELILYEIKSDLEPRTVIRQALGQILEYAFHSPRERKLPVRLFIVGRNAPSPEDQKYLNLLKAKFSLPLEYRVIADDS